MNRGTMTMTEVEAVIENCGYPVYLDYNGSESTKEEVLEQFEEGWHVGVVIRPVSNAISEMWIISTDSHRNHHGFDGGKCVELMCYHESNDNEDDANSILETFVNSGGMVFQVE